MLLAIINLTFSEGDFMSPDASAPSKRSHTKKLRAKQPDPSQESLQVDVHSAASEDMEKLESQVRCH